MLNYVQDKELERKAFDLADKKFKNISKLKEKQNVIFAKNQKTEIYLVSDELLKIFNIVSKSKHPYTLGFYFGEISKDISFGFETLYKYAKKSDYHKAKISRKAEMKFLYGRDIKADQLRDYDEDLRIGDNVVVCNKSNEAIGLGVVVSNLKKARRAEVVIKNLKDRGWYLRHKE